MYRSVFFFPVLLVLVALTATLVPCAATEAETLGAGASIGVAGAPDSDYDITAGPWDNGFRNMLDLSSSATLAAGVYDVSEFKFFAHTGTAPGVHPVVPFLATYDGTAAAPASPDECTVVWVDGAGAVTDGTEGVHTKSYAPGTQQITLAAETELFAGTSFQYELSFDGGVAPIPGSDKGMCIQFKWLDGSAFTWRGGSTTGVAPVLNEVIPVGGYRGDYREYAYDITVNLIPEPGTLALLATGLLGLLAVRRKRG